MYEVILSDKVKKQFKKLDRNIQRRVVVSLGRIRIRPEVYVTKLVGDPGYKLRVGNYRIILDIDKNRLLILVVKIGHRKNIYK